jgi:nitrogen fixation NifU-like protein
MIDQVLWFLCIGLMLFAILGLWVLAYCVLNPHIEEPHGEARITGRCGDTMEIGLQFEENRVAKATHWTDGCVYSLNCVCAAAELAKGRSPDEILSIDADVIQQRIGRLPQDYMHCARLAAETLIAALESYMKKTKHTVP